MNDCTWIEERVVEYLGNELTPEDRAALDAHAAGCAPCRATLRAYLAIQDAYRAVPEVDASSASAERVLAAARNRRSSTRRPLRLLLAAAAVFFAVLIPFVYLSTRPTPNPAAELVDRADAERSAGNLVEAEATYEAALASVTDASVTDAPAAVRALSGLATLHADRGDLEGALAHIERLLEWRPDPTDRRNALLLRGELLAKLGRRDQARQTYLELVAEYPSTKDEVERRIGALHDPNEDLQSALRALGYGGE